MSDTGTGLSVSRGAALYVGGLIGPGVLLVPALAADAAGPASIVAWAALLVLSSPLALTFAALGVRHPVAGGVAAYVREGFGETASAVTGAWFVTAILLGAPAVALIGGFYVADLVGGGRLLASLVALAIFAAVLAANVSGLRVSSGVQLALSAVLVAVIATAVAVALPGRATDGWTPFTPHGWFAVGTAANILMWLFFGWEVVAQMAGEFRDPGRDLPRAMALAFGVITVLYVGLGVATIAVGNAARSRVPLADLVGVGFGRAGRDATAVLAVALTMGTMNVYTAASARLAAAVACDGGLPRWLAGGASRSVPRRPLAVLAVVGTVMLIPLALDAWSPAALIRATSACFVAVYVLALASAVRILGERARAAAVAALACVLVVLAFSSFYLVFPAAAALVAVACRRVFTTAAGRTLRRRD